eukprot:1500047-Rhodomonas_salina.1
MPSFAPTPKSFLLVRDFASPKHLADHLLCDALFALILLIRAMSRVDDVALVALGVGEGAARAEVGWSAR